MGFSFVVVVSSYGLFVCFVSVFLFLKIGRFPD